MNRASKLLIHGFTILMVGAAQVFGLAAGYACECTGGVEFVNTPECVSSVCHPGRPHQTAHEHEGDLGTVPGESNEDHPEHSAVMEALTGMSVPGPMTAPVAILAVISFPAWRNFEVNEVLIHSTFRVAYERGIGAPTQVLVARTMVLLV